MRELIITVKTDLQSAGMLFEVSPDIRSKDLLQALMKDVELTVEWIEDLSNTNDFHLMKTGKMPVEIKDHETLSDVGVSNGDILLIYFGDYIHSGIENFSFEPLLESTIDEQSPQVLRAPLRMPVREQQNSSGTNQESILQTNQKDQTVDDDLIAEPNKFAIHPDERNPTPIAGHKKKKVPKHWKEVDID